MRVLSLLATACFITMPLAAQDAVVKGKVTSQSGEPLGGANVVVANTNLGAVTAANGTYTLTIGSGAVRGQQVILTARYIGHKPVTRTISLTAGEQTQDFTLAADPLRLEEVVVTGVAEATEQRLRDPLIEFFVRSNPGHAQGDELVCVAPISRSNLTRAGHRLLETGGER